MKYLRDRQEIGKVMNFGKYPVLVLNRENHKGFEDTDYCVGQKVKVAWDNPRYEGMTTKGNIYLENGEIAISNESACLTARFGYSDIMEDAEWANAPTIHKGQTVVVVEQWASKKICTVRMMKVSDRIDIHCIKVASLKDIE